MANSYCEFDGVVVEHILLRAPKAKELALVLLRADVHFAELVECRLSERCDTVVFEVDVPVPQLPVYAIEKKERIAVHFDLEDRAAPEVLAIREDFPLVPHRNIREYELPRSLCLYEESYRDQKRSWTAATFLRRIQEWLELTAKGILHQEDQPLEPLLSGDDGHIVLPHDLLGRDHSLPIHLYISENYSKYFLVARSERPRFMESHAVVASIHTCPTKQHGTINRKPDSLKTLSDIVSEGDFNLLIELKRCLRDWTLNERLTDEHYNNPLVIILACPKARDGVSKPESVEYWALRTDRPIIEVGREIGCWDITDGKIGIRLDEGDSNDGSAVKLDLLNPSFELTRGLAAKLNGLTEPVDYKIVSVGAGALGSQVVMNLAKSGFGNWHIIDNDILMPHNVVRHALNDWQVGSSKAMMLAIQANSVAHDLDLFEPLPVDIMAHHEETHKALKGADVILDMSASVTVARYLVLNAESSARRVSLFMTPSGKDLVMLAEDKSRSATLDVLEMQYYRAILHGGELDGHFEMPKGRRRYGQSCRDITSTLPQESAALHAAIGARAVRYVTDIEAAGITVWRSDDRGNVKRIDVDIAPVMICKLGEWAVRTDALILSKLFLYSMSKSPNETGGILLGSFDIERKMIYIVDTIPSPPDSKEHPTHYIRGVKGLQQDVIEVSDITNGMLTYVGEWHSHTCGNTSPSADDKKVFSQIEAWMANDGLPPLMMIVGTHGQASLFVDNIGTEVNIPLFMEKL